MAAKLEWNGERIMLGGQFGWTLGAVRREGKAWRAVLNRSAERSAEHENVSDAMQDLETEVRRLLLEAGVETE